jgi:hypothetical protein
MNTHMEEPEVNSRARDEQQRGDFRKGKHYDFLIFLGIYSTQ